MKRYLTLFLLLTNITANAQFQLASYNPLWTSQSKNSGESMPCGGGDIGLNVWVEKGEVLFYVSRSGTFDENNTLLKQGRVRIKLSPNPFDGSDNFRQELILKDGYVKINGKKGDLESEIKVWVDVFNPVVNVEVNSTKPVTTAASYESWRYKDRATRGRENNANSYKWAPQGEVKTLKDEIAFQQNAVMFYHQNQAYTVFDVTVKQQGMDNVKDQLFNPLKNLVFGGILSGEKMISAGTAEGRYMDTDFRSWTLKSAKSGRSQRLTLALHTEYTAAVDNWNTGLNKTLATAKKNPAQAFKKTRKWWNEYWNRSFIAIEGNKPDSNSEDWQVGRNYQLMRYMLGCNAYGAYPTKFNGGLFTFDPSLTDSAHKFTPDFRNWGGGTHTAQNQRLVYWPMLRSGDFDLMKPQFKFYQQTLRNAELRSETYWDHKGASFTEQLENFGLPNPAEYNWKRPAGYDKGMEHNAWLEYQWDTVLEFCLMMLETERYTGKDIREYVPFIESCLTFFNEHYQYLAKQRGSKTFDANGHLVFYPGSAAETYKMAYNANSTLAALRTVLSRLLELPSSVLAEEKKEAWRQMLKRIPPITFREFNGKPTIAPAKLWERINNTESPQLYPVFPWGIYGIGRPGLDTAINTFKYDTDVLKFRSHVGWKQDNIFAARLGLTKEAAELTTLKLKDSGRRFPAFYGPGFDWTPDHNWGGSGMIGLQEMLMQSHGRKIYLFPAWPKDKDVHFKLHAAYQTTVEAKLENGKMQVIKVIPENRRADIIMRPVLHN
ncbi:DUF5703 domain-containing protein [Desertivirga xinjiangensis]|uniref:DUF5703 domain-containing protein n=1 Tax=Desertivirga xinjiangensis TaxID=539206 RepID=UPI00210B0601|nr:DUF5703 domain-containing protein [Pedobacter xinjiangensis]